MQFIPDAKFETRLIPYFEDASQNSIAGGDLRKPIDFYKNRITDAVTKLGGLVTGFIPVHSSDAPLRYGYRLVFILAGVRGQIDIAALPIRHETKIKKEKALKQALYLCWKELDAQANAWVYRPNSMPLLPFLIGKGGETVTESLMRTGILPDVRPLQLTGGNNE